MKKGESITIRVISNEADYGRISNNADYGEKHIQRSIIGYGIDVLDKLGASGHHTFIHIIRMKPNYLKNWYATSKQTRMDPRLRSKAGVWRTCFAQH